MPITILAVIGMLTLNGNQWRLKLALIIFLLLYTLSFRHSLFFFPRYIIFVAPIFCLFAATSCITLLRNQHTVLRWLGVTAASLAIIYSAGISAIGAIARNTDPRVDAAQFISKSYPGEIKIGFSMISEKYIGTHRWRNPRIVNNQHQVVSILEEPDVIVTNSYVLDQIEPALNSPHLQEAYVWDPEENRMWYRYSPPSPRLFEFYEQLLEGAGSYKLKKVFPRSASAGIEYAPPEIRIFERISRLKKKRGSRPT